ncbi:glutamate--cysteine ligase [Amphibacillus jilinensis]|uniref:glutamate--cysteine ligase n=1 Tax=Amphibacillus jilinensis TaxID=1216008 RepID=UPI0002E59144|nr:glutamate--cysteine ligase [Amphibacillus jilinensis]
MDEKFTKVLSLFDHPDRKKLLLDGLWGIERETQRITADGHIALTDHPAIFGNKRMNNQITVDFAENQLEFVTRPHPSIDLLYAELKEISLIADQGIGDQRMWPMSMPPRLPREQAIPIAKFDHSSEGQAKEVYRKGLALRYGKKLQMISGIHYNYSLGNHLLQLLHQHFHQEEDMTAFKNKVYMKISRNFIKYRWLLIYLFGASPVADQSYDSVIEKELQKVSEGCEDLRQEKQLFKKCATSLRASRFGYSTEIQEQYQVSYNSLAAYIQDIKKLLSTESEQYRQYGVERDGERVQLNTSIIQNENEFYAPVRFKSKVKDNQSQIEALEQRGIDYIEIRLLDINPFSKWGVCKTQIDFVHLFVLFCLFEDSNPTSNQALMRASKNHQLVALLGRLPYLRLLKSEDQQIELKEWGEAIFAKLYQIAELIDHANRSDRFRCVVAKERDKLHNRLLLPAEKIVNEMKQRQESYIDFGLRLANQYKSKFCKDQIEKEA